MPAAPSHSRTQPAGKSSPRKGAGRRWCGPVKGETAEAEKIKTFHDEYFAVLDLTEEFYLQTIDRIFHKAELATGDFTCRGRKVNGRRWEREIYPVVAT